MQWTIQNYIAPRAGPAVTQSTLYHTLKLAVTDLTFHPSTGKGSSMSMHNTGGLIESVHAQLELNLKSGLRISYFSTTAHHLVVVRLIILRSTDMATK